MKAETVFMPFLPSIVIQTTQFLLVLNKTLNCPDVLLIYNNHLQR